MNFLLPGAFAAGCLGSVTGAPDAFFGSIPLFWAAGELAPYFAPVCLASFPLLPGAGHLLPSSFGYWYLSPTACLTSYLPTGGELLLPAGDLAPPEDDLGSYFPLTAWALAAIYLVYYSDYLLASFYLASIPLMPLDTSYLVASFAPYAVFEPLNIVFPPADTSYCTYASLLRDIYPVPLPPDTNLEV